MRITRRELLKKMGIGAMAFAGGHFVASKFMPAESAFAAEEDKWKQFAGTTLMFLGENTPPTLAIKAKIAEFTELTGIAIEIVPDSVDVIRTKLAKDLNAQKASYVLYYSQDNPIGAVFFDLAADLRAFESDPTLPQTRDGVGDKAWGYRWLDVTGRFYGSDKISAYPYDNAINVMMYRRDLFEKYSPQFEQKYGKPLQYTEATTWKDVSEMCVFFKEAKLPDVKYGIALWGKKGWPAFADFQRFAYSHGQWTEWDFDPYFGSRAPGPCRWGDQQSILTLSRYKELAAVAHPQSFRYDWDGVNTVYCAGEVAMVVNVGEYAGAVEHPQMSKAAGGRTAYGLCPKGEAAWIVNNGQAAHGTNYGIGGIAINKYADPRLQKAAYLFVLWSTSHETQYMVLTETGGTPTRQSVFDLPEVRQAFQRETAPMTAIPPVEIEPGVVVNAMPTMPIALTYPFSQQGIVPPNVVLGPKIPAFNEYVDIMSSEIQKCLGGMKTPEKACHDIKKKTDALHGIG